MIYCQTSADTSDSVPERSLQSEVKTLTKETQTRASLNIIVEGGFPHLFILMQIHLTHKRHRHKNSHCPITTS